MRRARRAWLHLAALVLATARCGAPTGDRPAADSPLDDSRRWDVLSALTPPANVGCAWTDATDLSGQCVAHVRRVWANIGLTVNWSGNAETWIAGAIDNKWQTASDIDALEKNAIAVWHGGKYGHVAVVESLSRDASGAVQSVTVSEMNWGSTCANYPDAPWITSKTGIPETHTLDRRGFLTRGSGRTPFLFAGAVLPRKVGQSTPANTSSRFDIDASPTSTSVAQGDVAVYQVRIANQSSATTAFDLGVLNLPGQRVLAPTDTRPGTSIVPSSLVVGGNATAGAVLYVPTDNATTPRDYAMTLRVHASDGVQKDIPLDLTVTAGSPSLGSLTLVPAAVSIHTGQVIALLATDQRGGPIPSASVSWTSSNAAVAAVNGQGQVTGITAGSVVVRGVSKEQPAISASSTVTVTSASAPADFTVAVSPSSRSVSQGQSALYVVTLQSQNGFAGTVDLSALHLPGDLVLPGTGFSPATAMIPSGGSATAVLTIATNSRTPIGQAMVTIQAQGGGLSHSAPVALVVAAQPAPPSGTMSATPNPCTVTVPGGTCSLTLSWSTTNVSAARVVVVDATGATQTLFTTTAGSQTLNWIQALPQKYTFYLYDYSPGSQGPLLASVSVAVPAPAPTPHTGTITANPNPCTVTVPGGTCSLTLSWSTTNVSAARVVVVDATGATQTLFTTTAGSQTLNWIQALPQKYTFYLYDYSPGSQGPLLASVSVAVPAPTPSQVVLTIDGGNSSTKTTGQTFTVTATGLTPNGSVTRYLRDPNNNLITLTPPTSATPGGTLSWSFTPTTTTPKGSSLLWVVDNLTLRSSNTVLQVVQ